MAQLVVETHDLDQAAAIMRQQYAASTINAPGRTSGLRVVQGSLGGVLLSDIDYFMDATFTVEDLDVTYVARAISGTMVTRIGRQDNRWGTGEACLLGGAGATLECSVYDAQVEFAVIDPATFQAVASAVDGTPAFTGDTPLSPAAARNWNTTFTFAQQVAAQPEVPALVADTTARLVAATALATFPNNTQTAPTIQDRRDGHPATLRRAISYIESHSEQPISVVDIARAAFVTPRAIQLAFRQHLDTTPMAYLRRVRLAGAHTDLQAADPAVTTITAIAAHWGFANPGRFASQYRQTYGRTPKATFNASYP